MGRSLNGRGSQKTCLAILELDFRVHTEPADRYKGLRKLGAALQAYLLEGLFLCPYERRCNETTVKKTKVIT
jgi:hypothetical protein